MNITQFQNRLINLMPRISTLALSTVDDVGQPHGANVNFVSDERLNIYFLSSPDSDHSQHIARRPHIAACGYPAYRLPTGIKGVQLKGTCVQCPADQWERLWKQYCRKFAYAIPMKKRARRDAFYHVKPDWVRLIDNSVSFGFKMETDWPQ